MAAPATSTIVRQQQVRQLSSQVRRDHLDKFLKDCPGQRRWQAEEFSIGMGCDAHGSSLRFCQLGKNIGLDDHSIASHRSPPSAHDLSINNNDIAQGIAHRDQLLGSPRISRCASIFVARNVFIVNRQQIRCWRSIRCRYPCDVKPICLTAHDLTVQCALNRARPVPASLAVNPDHFAKSCTVAGPRLEKSSSGQVSEFPLHTFAWASMFLQQRVRELLTTPRSAADDPLQFRLHHEIAHSKLAVRCDASLLKDTS